MTAKTAKQPTEVSIEIPPLKIQTLYVKVIGDSPLISHKWSDKAKKQMLDKQMKKAKQAKAAKDPFREFVDSLYWISTQPEDPAPDDVAKAHFGFPAVAFKACAVDACSHVDGITKVSARGAFHIAQELIAIEGTPTMREDMVRIAMGTADIRYRGEFKQWKATLPLRYNAATLSADQILNLFELGGFGIGVGEWRPQKDGSYGMFHVARSGE